MGINNYQLPISNFKSIFKFKFLIIIFGVGVSWMPAKAMAANYYVATTGADINTGTQTQPWKTIQKAANAMVAGDTVTVLAGDYASQRINVTKSGSSGLPITFQAQGSVVMKGFKVTSSYVTIKGFEIANTDYVRWHAETSAGVYIKGSNNIVENNYIHDASLDGIDIYDVPTILTNKSSNNTIRNNRLYHNEMVGIDVDGRNNLIEGNEVWGSVQCHPTLTAVEDIAADNPNHLSCPNYPGVGGLDSDGMRFFGQGHIFRKNYIHDILYGPAGLNPAIGDYVDNSHIDCFQTWTNLQYNETAQNITFEQNFCDNAQANALHEAGSGFMIEGLAGGPLGATHSANLTIRNNIIRAYGGINSRDAVNLTVVNNIFANDPTLSQTYSPMGISLSNSQYPIIKNNIFYDQKIHTISIPNNGTTTNTYNDSDIDYNSAFNSDNSIPPCIAINNYVCKNLSVNDKWHIDLRFVDGVNRNFHLQPDSPLINAGYDLGNLVTNDYDSVSRPQWSGMDIGPFEYNGTTSSITPTPIPSSCPAGMAGYWPLDSFANNQTRDFVGTDHGYVIGATQVPGKVNGAFRFDSTDGSADYINVGNSPALNINGNGITLEAWINPEVSSSTRGILSKDGYGSGYRLLVGIDNTLNFQITGSLRSLNSIQKVTNGSWNHVVATYDGTSMNLYINGIKDTNKKTTSGPIDSSTNNLWIGNGSQDVGNNWSFPFKGLIDEVAVYNRALIQTEITDHYNSGNGKPYCGSAGVPIITSIPTPVPGDATGDGHVDGLDYVVWLNNYGGINTQGPPNGDFNTDGHVDGLDYVIWLNNYGK